MQPPIRLLAFTGSTRQRSSNTALLESLQLLAPPHVEVVVYRDLARLPHFNPDAERDLWSGETTIVHDAVVREVPPHGAVMLRIE